MSTCEFGCEYHFPCVECGSPHLGSHRHGCSHYGSSGTFRCRYCEKAEGLCAEHRAVEAKS